MDSKNEKRYIGIFNDNHGGMTDTGKIIRDAWIFGLIPETETCEGWLVQGIQTLWENVNVEWEKYGFQVTCLPPELRERFDRIQGEAVERAKKAGWNADFDLCDEV